MDSHSSPQSATRYRWHERIERYTPNGALGRLLIAALAGPFGILLLILSVGFFAVNGLLWPPLVVFVGVGLAASILTVVVLWPVYLSLIGNIESTKAYSQVDAPLPSEENRDDSIAVVKRQYAAGNISEEEFEQRVENLLHTDAAFGLQPEPMSYRDESKEIVRETN